jgi:hypothetical protein
LVGASGLARLMWGGRFAKEFAVSYVGPPPVALSEARGLGRAIVNPALGDQRAVTVNSGTRFGGWVLPRRGSGLWRALAIAVGCVLAGVLWTAAPAGASTSQWTVRNEAGHPRNVLTLESVTAWKDNPMEFKGRADDGSLLFPDHADQFELKNGANYQAVLKYGTVYGVEVEYWIRNALDFADSRCRFVTPRHEGDWTVKDEIDRSSLRLFCYATPFSRTLYFTDSLNSPPPPQ